MFNPDQEPKQESGLEKIEFTSEEKELISRIKERGIEDEEIRALFVQWVDGWRTKIEQAENDNLAQINFLRRRAYLYLQTNYLEEAVSDFDDAIELAYQMKLDDVVVAIEDDMNKLFSK